ncbi:HAD family hydrolase [Fuscibacter oryzae]|uniref:HAD family hydrolase n=1 Tax=Fuscibacter oryzae TaxID=2803939 RepID=A0A8J7SWX3_9RHOB|nr:HAD family hydrolase [Fuscibacter oryzae]MBL4930136.1 HAD family hydrolase [Fuscibacter oryzae]
MTIDLVIFDCDGVLIDSELISARMLVNALADLGLSIDLDYVSRHFLGRSYPVVMDTIRREFGLDLPPDFEATYRENLLAAFDRELRVMPGVAQVMASLTVPYCVATSSSPRRVAFSLRHVGLDHLVGDRVFTASQVSRGKPAPDLFLFAATQMATPPARCLVIEDSLTGVRAGLAAGMTVWRFTGGSHMSGLDGPEPEDARPHARFAAFDTFATLAPDLMRQP